MKQSRNEKSNVVSGRSSTDNRGADLGLSSPCERAEASVPDSVAVRDEVEFLCGSTDRRALAGHPQRDPVAGLSSPTNDAGVRVGVKLQKPSPAEEVEDGGAR